MSQTSAGTALPDPATLMNEYAPRVYRLAYRLLDNDADAEDVTQDVLLAVVRHGGSLRGEASFMTWLHRVTVNAALSFRRKRAHREGRREAQAVDDVPDPSGPSGPVRRWALTPEQQAVDRETARLIEGGIRRLPAGYRDVYVLADVEGLPNQEIAETLGLGVAAVKSRLHRARLWMRNVLAPHFEEKV